MWDTLDDNTVRDDDEKPGCLMWTVSPSDCTWPLGVSDGGHNGHCIEADLSNTADA